VKTLGLVGREAISALAGRGSLQQGMAMLITTHRHAIRIRFAGLCIMPATAQYAVIRVWEEFLTSALDKIIHYK
jgi:hypothetical protein